MKLTEHFTLEELTTTSTGLANIPKTHQIDALKNLAINILEPLRKKLGKPIIVTSGFRSQLVNAKVHGAKLSQHCDGEAADLTCEDNSLMFDIIRKGLDFDQLIWEAGNDEQPAWVHVSYRGTGNRGNVLRMINGQYITMP